MPKRVASLLAAAALLALSACANLDEVARLDIAAADARHALPRVAADLYDTCRRRSAILARVPPDQLPPDQPTTSCAPYQALATHIAAHQAVLLDYLDALSKLASSGSTYAKSIDTDLATVSSLTPGSANAALFADAQTAGLAALSLTKELAKIATRRYREREIRRLILASDPSVQQLTAALRRVVVTDYGIMLDSEKTFLDSYYLAPMSAPAANTQEPLALLLVQRQYDTDLARLAHRRDSALAYGLLMDRISSVHAKLTQAANSPSNFSASVQQLSPDIDALTEAATALLVEVT